MAIKHLYILCFLLLLSFISKGRTYSVVSLEGSKATINVDFLPVDNTVKIYNKQNGMLLQDVIDLTDVKVLNKNFLYITYKARVGSNIKKEMGLLLSVSNGKLFESLHIMTRYKVEFKRTYDKPTDLLQTYNELEEFSAAVIKCNTDSLCLKCSYVNKSKQQNRATILNDNFCLKFDTKQKIFANSHKKLIGHYTCYNPEMNTTTQREYNEIFPTVALMDYEYYFINGFWYELNQGNYLVQLIGSK